MIQEQLDPATKLLDDAAALTRKTISMLITQQFHQFPRVAEAICEEAAKVIES
jgi:tRNA nucleotidyltransferase/poly(A) polymerase